MFKNIRQQSVDMGLILGKNMGGWVFFIFGRHTPLTFLDKYLSRVGICDVRVRFRYTFVFYNSVA